VAEAKRGSGESYDCKCVRIAGRQPVAGARPGSGESYDGKCVRIDGCQVAGARVASPAGGIPEAPTP